MKVNHIAVGAALLVASLNAKTELRATDLTFDGTSGAIDQAYGDRVTSTTMDSFGYGQHGEGFTPNVTVAYDPVAGSPRVWPTGYGDLVGPTLYESSSTEKLQVQFSADPGFRVRLHRWDMATYSAFFHGDGETINGVTVYNALGTPLFSQTNVFVPTAGHVRFDSFTTPLVDTTLTLEMDARNVTVFFGNADIGFDNVVFSQVPEPTSAILAAVGMALAWTAIDRKRKRHSG